MPKEESLYEKRPGRVKQYNILSLFNVAEVYALETTINELAAVGWEVESMQVDNGRFYVLLGKLF